MPVRLSVPANVAYALELQDGRLFVDSATRNVAPIAAVIDDFAPDHGVALEIASGTGQHVVEFAGLRDKLIWQPTDANPDRLPSIDLWIDESERKNIRPAKLLDASEPGWSRGMGPYSLIVIVNLLHLVSIAEAQTILSESAKALQHGGVIVIYGPFLRDNRATSEGDWMFDAELQSADPDIGYKDDGAVIDWLNENGLLVEAPISMPANNLCFVATKPGALD